MKPLILDNKEVRNETNSPVTYEYDVDRSLNVVRLNGEKKVFIDLESTDMELLTKTKVQRESDDDHFFMELGSKTEVRRERDDPRDAFLELSTKTFTVRERDDEDPSYYQ